MDSAMKAFTEICQTLQTINSLKHLSKYSPLKRQLHKMVKHSETIPRNCLSEFDHFVRLAKKILKYI